jgi:hypothetical protein
MTQVKGVRWEDQTFPHSATTLKVLTIAPPNH